MANDAGDDPIVQSKRISKLSPSELETLVDDRVEVEFELARQSYMQQRGGLLQQLRATSDNAEKTRVIEELDKCERNFSVTFAEFRSGQRKRQILSEECRKLESPVQRKKELRSRQQERAAAHSSAKKPKPASAGALKKSSLKYQPTKKRARVEVREVTEVEVQNLRRMGYQVVYVFRDRADCILCGRTIRLTADKTQWVTHENRLRQICSPSTTKVVFVSNRLKKPNASHTAPSRGKKRKRTTRHGQKSEQQNAVWDTIIDLREMDERNANGGHRAWRGGRGQGVPPRITKVVLGGAPGSARR